MFTADELFDLTRFPYDIFESNQPAWVALQKLDAFLRRQILGVIEGELEEGVHLVHPELISIGKGTRVEAGAYIVGPCLIGAECELRHGAYLRGGILAADHVVIGHATEVKNSIFMHGAQAGHFAYVGDSIVGNFVNVGAGTKFANLRFDRKPVRVQGVETGMRKLGAILADGAQTGCNCVTSPGTIVMRYATILPCSHVKGVIESA